ncbi:MAG: hybrid sensor histidine kinase/response regulator, partial [Pseudomonadota bacterium]|nr:hybrid sensor histidine kinase/response regulator [Pseudomonadota bacterium]
MSMSSFIDDETLQEYISESLEHLADIEQDLLTIEEGGADIDEEVVNRVFRAAHSLKGGAGFLALDTIKELAHKIENVLDMMRNREIAPNPEIINILLNSFDKLRDLINNSSTSNEEDIDEFVVALVGLTTAHLAPTEQASVSNMIPITKSDDSVIFEVPEIDLAQAKKGAQTLYLLEYDLIHDVYQHGKTPMEIIKNVMDLGTIIETLIDIDRVGTLDDAPINSIPFYMLISSIIEPIVAPDFLELPTEKILLIGNDGKQLKESGQAETQTQAAPAPPPAPTSAKTSLEPAPPIIPEPKEIPSPETALPRTPEKPAPTPAPAPTPEAGKTAPAKKEEPAKTEKSDAPTSLRVSVNLLESLMTLAGEMVLSRNQLLQAISQQDQHSIKLSGQRIDLVTSELQEAIMLTRMQPIGSVFNKFPRVVRDMSQKLTKEINLIITGKDVELDKTIVEGLNDPLTHLIRNSADHGIETPEIRIAASKPRAGKIELKAYHEAGQVNIEITDDGNGLDAERIADKALEKGMISTDQHKAMSRKEKMALILLPSLSTAEKVTDVSGRGVGMDVVKSNIDLLGGQIEIDSEMGQGTTIKIKLPLTLAIIPSLLVSVGEERFAVPQVNVCELVRIGSAQVKDRIERVGDSEVMPLRGELIPLIRLASVLGIQSSVINPESGEEIEDRRQTIADRRSPTTAINESLEQTPDEEFANKRSGRDRRYKASSDLNIVVVSAGSFKYGLVVDELHDSIEIVVKPMGRHLKHLASYAGATIMGDGRVALILDVAGIAKLADLISMAGSKRAQDLAEVGEGNRGQDRQSLLLFRNGPEEPCAVPLEIVERVEQVQHEDIETKSGQKVIKYRGGSLPLFALSDVSEVAKLIPEQELVVIVFTVAEREIGLLASQPVDTVEIKAIIDRDTLRDTGIMGSSIIKEQTTLIIDIYELVETLKPEWFERLQKRKERKKETLRQGSNSSAAAPLKSKKILLVEDSDFFRSQLKKYIDDDERQCVPAEDGLVAWNWLQEHPDELSLIITDIEIPNMDGFELCSR